MSLQVIQSVWPVLALLGFVLVTAVLAVLAGYHRHAVAVHDRVRESKARRRAYLESVRDRQNAGAETA
jgi:hypothetical protein